MDDWTKKSFSSVVNITDEALVMQIVKHYVPKWCKAGAEEMSSEGSSVAGDSGGKSEDGRQKRGGAVKGDTMTCVKQKACFYEYCIKVKQARSSPNSAKWDLRLKEEAIKRMMEQEEKAKAHLSDESDACSENQDGKLQENSNNMFVHGMFDDDDTGEQDEV